MQIKEVTVSKGLTVNVGNYESVRVNVELRCTIEDGEDHDQVTRTGFELIDARLNEQVDDVQDILSGTSAFKNSRQKQSTTPTVSRKRK